MTKVELKELIKSSLSLLQKNDSYIIENKVKEESINHRFAIYFEQEFQKKFTELTDIRFDLEYNKNYFDDKEVVDEDDKRLIIRPDFIVHEMFTNDNNLVAFEMKKSYITKKDKRTISGLLREPFNYNYGVMISYFPEKNYFRICIHTIDDEVFTHYSLSKIDLINF